MDPDVTSFYTCYTHESFMTLFNLLTVAGTSCGTGTGSWFVIINYSMSQCIFFLI